MTPSTWPADPTPGGGGDKTNTGLDFVLTVKVTILSALRTWSEVTCSGLSPEDLNEGVPSE